MGANQLSNDSTSECDFTKVISDSVNKISLQNWLDSSKGILHLNKLQIDNPTIEKVLQKFNNNSSHVYNNLRTIYWHYYKTEADFLTAIENNLETTNNIEDLITALKP